MFHQERELWSSNLRWPFNVGLSLWPNIASVKTDNLDLIQNICWWKRVWQPKFPLYSPLKGGAVCPGGLSRWRVGYPLDNIQVGSPLVQVEGGSIIGVGRVVSDHLCPVKVASPGGDQLLGSGVRTMCLCFVFICYFFASQGRIDRTVSGVLSLASVSPQCVSPHCRLVSWNPVWLL